MNPDDRSLLFSIAVSLVQLLAEATKTAEAHHDREAAKHLYTSTEKLASIANAYYHNWIAQEGDPKDQPQPSNGATQHDH
jgi:hypothetical protein